MRYLLVVCMAGVLSDCAKSPDSIAALPVPDVIYENRTCEQLRVQKAEAAIALATVSSQQSNAATSDAWGVALVGLPLSSMTGNDVSGKVAEAKGRVAAIETVMARKGCT